MYHKYLENEIRSICKEKLESLEYWLRRIIDETLKKAFGNYFDYVDTKGNRLINNRKLNALKLRVGKEPERYHRMIDAILLDDAIDIICNPKIYKDLFSDIFRGAFPEGRNEVLTFMKKLITPRNMLYHANPISIRQAEQVICYSNDIIDSIKEFYTKKNMDNEYNVPLILKFIDSFGNMLYRNQMESQNDGGISKSFENDPRFYLRVGDILTIEVEVDSSFNDDEYEIKWGSTIGFAHARPNGKKAFIEITEKQVCQRFDIQCRIISNKNWHKLYQGMDDFMILRYKVLPP